MKPIGVLVAAAAGVCGSLVLVSPWREPSSPVAFSGCTRAVEGPVCEMLPDKVLTLWIEGGPFDPLTVDVDGERLSIKTEVVSGGVQIRVPSPPPGLLSVSAEAAGGERHISHLRIAPYEPVRPPKKMLKARKAQDLKAFERLPEGTSKQHRALRYRRLGGMANRIGDIDSVLKYQGRAAEIAAEIGEWSGEARSRFARIFVLGMQRFRPEEAEQEIARLARLEDKFADVAAYLPYYRAIIRMRVGDMNRTYADLRTAGQWARALGLVTLVDIVDKERARVDRWLGHYEAALATDRRRLAWAADNDRPCIEARAATNIGWTLILMRERGLPVAEEPEDWLSRALSVFERGCRKNRNGAFVARINLAFAALQSGDPDLAQKWLEGVREDRLPVLHRPWTMEAKARIALARDQTDVALEVTDDLIALAKTLASDDTLYRAFVLQAEILTRRGSLAEALQARTKAEQTLDRLAVSIPLVGARHSFLTVRDDNVLGLAALLVVQDRPGAALAAIRRARSRSLGWARLSRALARLSPEARARWNVLVGEYREVRNLISRDVENDWKRSKLELDAIRGRRSAQEVRLSEVLTEALSLLPAVPIKPPTDLDVLHLSWIRLGSKVMVLGQLGDDSFAAPWPDGHNDVPPAVADRLRVARTVLLHPYGELRTRDLHMLQWRGRPLAAQVDVAYSLDLPSISGPVDTRTALVVVDPAEELARGREEARVVEQALTRHDVKVTTMRGDMTEVGDELGRVDWFHFGGHGQWTPDDPMAGGLALADGARLGLGDILASTRVPATVVLTSCEAGRGAGRGGEAFGLAHAFLAVGARVVVAPNREVTDEEAAQFSRAFYEADGDPKQRYRAAVARLGAAASAFRVFIP